MCKLWEEAQARNGVAKVSAKVAKLKQCSNTLGGLLGRITVDADTTSDSLRTSLATHGKSMLAAFGEVSLAPSFIRIKLVQRVASS